MANQFFGYRFDSRFKVLWWPLGAREGVDGVTLTNDGLFVATFGRLRLETPMANVIGGHVAQGYRWYTAVGARLSFADDGLTFGTNRDAGVCVHFQDRVPKVLGFKPHSALTVTVNDCAGLVDAIGLVD